MLFRSQPFQKPFPLFAVNPFLFQLLARREFLEPRKARKARNTGSCKTRVSPIRLKTDFHSDVRRGPGSLSQGHTYRMFLPLLRGSRGSRAPTQPSQKPHSLLAVNPIKMRNSRVQFIAGIVASIIEGELSC